MKPVRLLSLSGVCAVAVTIASGFASAAPPASKATSSPVVRLTLEPGTVALHGPRALAHVLVTAQMADGSQRDVTLEAQCAPGPTAPVVVDRDSVLRPRKDGTGNVTFTYGGKAVSAKVTVKEAQKATPVSFNNEIIPILTRNGCNMGTCHGAQFGKGGFKISLAGFDPDQDYLHIAKQARGRRLSVSDPAHSLLLTKATLSVPHGGGRRLEIGSPDYKTLARWLRDGAPGPNPADPTIAKIDVYPAERILPKGSAPQRLVVRATYSDGTSQDVTAQTRLGTLNDAVATCTPEGLVRSVNRGQTSIMVRYGGLATVATVIVPFDLPLNSLPKGKGLAGNLPLPFREGGRGVRSGSPLVDALVARKQRQLQLEVSPVCDDATFLRRVSVDLTGTTPTPEEIRAFLANTSPDKRAKKIDALLASPEYADYWTLKWGDLLRSNRTALGPKGMWSFTNWIREQFQQNRPIDQTVRDLIVAQGSTFTNGPSNYYRVASNPQDLAETTSQVFLGIRLQCAKCHQHPFEKWSQKDYYQFAAFFARVGLKGSNEFGLFGNEQVVRINDGGEVYHPKNSQQMYPTPLGLKLAALPDGKMPNPDAEGDRRAALAEWLVGKNNRFFARNIANRYWGYLMGRGIVHPIDDVRSTNPPSNPALLDALADELVKSNYDLKHLLRVICNSQTYQRSADATPQNRADEMFFTHYVPKRLSAESLLDAIDTACGTQEKYPDLPPGTRAIQLPDSSVNSDFLDTFGRPQRLIACECERMAEPNLSQTLRLMNGEQVNRKVTQGDGRIAKMIAAKKSNETILNELYLVTLGRMPNLKERNVVMGLLAFTADRKPVFEDVLVTLLNSKEFLFNH